MPIRFISHARTAIDIHRRIGKESLRAACIVVQNQARKNARGGFKSGDFVTTGWNTINHDIVESGNGFQGFVGTPLRHFAYWELGHKNLFTRQFEQKEWLRPAMMETKSEQQEAATAAARAVVRTAGIPGGSFFVRGRVG